MFKFETAKPGETGISVHSIENFIKRLSKAQIPMHSILLMRHDKLVLEAYYAPFNQDSLHRMFSISKSLTAIGIGFLMEEGKLSLDDTIIDFFPDMLPEKVHPWLAKLTIRNMLEMRTCHANTTYVINQTKDWTKSFFTKEPTLPPGKIFHYDTSSAQTLCALVERLSGMCVLDYVKGKLSDLELSDNSYMLKDPVGTSIGGSGLVATSRDLLKFGYFLSHRGNVNGKQLMNSSYIDLVTAKHSDSNMSAPIPEEAHGYGMQFWRYRNDGYMCYGMGGQFIIILPKEDIVLVTTADTQGLAGGNQVIHDAFFDEIVYKIGEGVENETEADLLQLNETLSKLKVEPVCGELKTDKAFINRLNSKTFKIEDNVQGFDDFSFKFEKNKGCVSYTLKGEKLTQEFGFGENVEGTFTNYNMWYTGSAIWARPDTLYVRFRVLGAFLGTIHMEFVFGEDDVLIEMKKVEESIFTEYNCRLFGKEK